MAKIYKRSDKFKIKIDDIVVTISPLTLDQKTEAQMLIAEGRVKGDYKKMTSGIVQLIKYAVREIDGLENSDGSKYQVQLENDMLTQESVEAIFGIELHNKLTMVCTSLLKSLPIKLVDEKGVELEGVSFVSTNVEENKNPN